MTVPDEKQRLQLEEKISRHEWSAEELAVHVKAKRPARFESSAAGPVIQKPLTPLRGTLYTYKIVKRPTLGAAPIEGRSSMSEKETDLLIDLGFGIFRELDGRARSRFSAEQMVETRVKEDVYALYATDRSEKDRFTYRAFIERVIDGDTLKVRFDLGFETWTRQILRLRGIDAPEMDTKEGLAAKIFIQSYIKEAQLVVVRSSRSDKYDRYLADVYIPRGDKPDPATDIYLNNLLLENGQAKRMME